MYRIGVDLGGTNIAVGVVDENYRIIATANRKTNYKNGIEALVDDIAEATKQAVQNAGLTLDDIESFGMGTPGSVDAKNGIICYANNLFISNVPIVEMLEKKTGKKFFIENDANAAAYGEYIAGAGKGTNNFVAITLGTGVGGGIIIDGKIYSGSNNAGAELGHTVICINGESCTCGRQGCWEAYASATALIRQTKQAMIKYSDSIMWQMCDGDINAVTGKTAFDAMRAGDSAGKAVVDKYVEYVAVGITNNLNIFQPEVICIGGGISKEGDNLIIPIKEYLKGENYARNIEKKAEIKIAALGNDAGIIGAAFLSEL